MKKKKTRKRRQKKLIKLNEINTKNLNWKEVTIGDYLAEEERNKLKLKVKYGTEQSLNLNELVKNNITIAEIPEIIPEDSDIEATSPHSETTVSIDATSSHKETTISIDTTSSHKKTTVSNVVDFKPILIIDSEPDETEFISNNSISIAEEEVAVTTEPVAEFITIPTSTISIDLETVAATKKREFEEYLEEEEKFKNFDKKLVEIARQPSQDTSSLFYRFVGRFFTEANTL